MLTMQDVIRFKNEVGSLPRPVLSLYLDVNPASPDFNPQAAAIRTRETLRKLDVPGEIARRVLEYLEKRGEPGRTLALFATRDDLHVVPLQVALPVNDPSTGHVLARFGEPYLLPMELALDEYQRYGVVYIDRQHWRFFDSFLGDFEEVLDAFRALSAEDVRRYDEARKQHPAYTATRSDSDRDNLNRAVAEWTHRFHKRAATLLDDQVNDRGIERLVLMGPSTQIRDYCNALPRRLRDRVVATLPSLTSPNAPTGEVRKRIEEAIHEIEREQETQILDRMRETGVSGVSKCLEALQANRVYVLAVPWGLDHPVYKDEETGYVAATEDLARKHSTQETPQIRMTNLRDVLLDLAQAYGARLEFVRDASEERVNEEFEGMAALTRW